MTKTNLIKRIAQKLEGYWDYTNTQVYTTKDVREADMLDALNDTIEEVYLEYSKENPEYYETEGTASTRETNSTISSISSTTLVAAAAVFTSDMVDGVIYNTTRSSQRKISAYTNTTTVTLDSAAPSDWAATDAFNVFTGIYTFGGDLDDIHGYPLYVGIKYNTTDDDYDRCTLYSDSQLYRTGRGRDKDDTFSEDDPVYSITKITVSSVETSAIKIRPIPITTIATGVFIKYNQYISLLSSADDEPRLPGPHAYLADGAIAKIADGHLNDFEKGDRYQARFQQGFDRLMDSVTSGDEKREVSRESHLDDFRNRTR